MKYKCVKVRYTPMRTECRVYRDMIKFSPVYTAEEMAAAQLADPDIRPLYVAKIVNQIRYARHGMKSAVNCLQQRRTWQSGRE